METPRRVLRLIHVGNVQQLSTPLKIPASPLMKTLGYGTGVNVYRLDRSPKCGQLRSPWALKRISSRIPVDTELFKSRMLEEAAILRKLSHPNIVGFRGVSTDKDGVRGLALECCGLSLGDILEERHEHNLGPLQAPKILKMIGDIAHALDYLHTDAKLLHGDLKSFNVLIKNDFEICKLCDFGVSLPIDDDGLIDFTNGANLRYVGTNIWCAPEIMDDSDVIDCKADIFSFGLVIYETIALVPPHTLTLSDENEENIEVPDETLKECMESEIETEEPLSATELIDRACGTRPPLPQAFELSDEYNAIVEFFYCCTNELPEDRPLAKTIWQSLEQLDIKDKK